MTLPPRIQIREVGPREGFQTITEVIPTGEKLALIDALSDSGLGDIEITSFVRPDRVPQMADADEVVRTCRQRPGVRYTALYLNPRGFVRGEDLQRLHNEGWLNIAASETFLQRNSNTTIAAALAAIPEWLAEFRRYGKPLQGVMLSTAFGCSWEGAISPERVLGLLGDVVSRCADEGMPLLEVCLADTVGRGNPEGVRRLVGETRARFPNLLISLHLHDTRGSGMPNVYAGLLEGVTVFDASIGGLGGCPFAKGAAGNVPTEDVAWLCEEMGIATGLSLEKLIAAAALAERIVGRPLPGKLYRSGWRPGQ